MSSQLGKLEPRSSAVGVEDMPDDPASSTYNSYELMCRCGTRHGDRTPKQKLKFTTHEQTLLSLISECARGTCTQTRAPRRAPSADPPPSRTAPRRAAPCRAAAPHPHRATSPTSPAPPTHAAGMAPMCAGSGSRRSD